MKILLFTTGCLFLFIAGLCLHHFCLWLERRGLLFYLHRKPGSSAASAFVAMQRLVEPATQHVEVADEELSRREDVPAAAPSRQVSARETAAMSGALNSAMPTSTPDPDLPPEHPGECAVS